MRIRIAAFLTTPFIWALALLLNLVTWMRHKLAGIEPVSRTEARSMEGAVYDFINEVAFHDLVEADWFQTAIKTIASTEAYRQIAYMRGQVGIRKFEEAGKAEAAATVFEDLPDVLNTYAQLYAPPERKK